jgi:hypothetical protein
MATSREWKDVAVRQGARADQAQRKSEAQEHALNLLLNGQMVEFYSVRTADGTLHDFSLGIARNVAIDDPRRKILSRKSAEDFPVVLWRSRFEPNRVYATAYEPHQFSGLTDQMIRLHETVASELPYPLVGCPKRAIYRNVTNAGISGSFLVCSILGLWAIPVIVLTTALALIFSFALAR